MWAYLLGLLLQISFLVLTLCRAKVTHAIAQMETMWDFVVKYWLGTAFLPIYII